MDDIRPSSRTTEARDPLTGLPTRLGLELIGEQVFARARREGEPIAILCLDGIAASGPPEQASAHISIVEVAKLLRSELRASDVIARTDEHQIGVLLPGADEAGIDRVVGHIEALIRQRNDQYEVEESSLPVIARSLTFKPWEEEDADADEVIASVFDGLRGGSVQLLH